MSELVSTEWLAEHLKDVQVVDASWYMPDEKREPVKEFETGSQRASKASAETG